MSISASRLPDKGLHFRHLLFDLGGVTSSRLFLSQLPLFDALAAFLLALHAALMIINFDGSSFSGIVWFSAVAIAVSLAAIAVFLLFRTRLAQELEKPNPVFFPMFVLARGVLGVFSLACGFAYFTLGWVMANLESINLQREYREEKQTELETLFFSPRSVLFLGGLGFIFNVLYVAQSKYWEDLLNQSWCSHNVHAVNQAINA